MTARRCPVCSAAIPDLPTMQPLTACSVRCRDRLQAAAEQLLNAITTPEPDEGTSH